MYAASIAKVPRTRCEIMVKKIIISAYTWKDLEEYFNMNRNILKKELEKFFEELPCFEKRMNVIKEYMYINEFAKPFRNIEFE